MVGLSWLGVEEMKREPSAATDSQAQLQSQARYKEPGAINCGIAPAAKASGRRGVEGLSKP